MTPDGGIEICPACGTKGSVGTLDSRPRVGGRWRRRHCSACKHRWSTIEVPMERLAAIVRGRRMIAQTLDQLRTVSADLEALTREEEDEAA